MSLTESPVNSRTGQLREPAHRADVAERVEAEVEVRQARESAQSADVADRIGAEREAGQPAELADVADRVAPERQFGEARQILDLHQTRDSRGGGVQLCEAGYQAECESRLGTDTKRSPDRNLKLRIFEDTDLVGVLGTA